MNVYRDADEDEDDWDEDDTDYGDTDDGDTDYGDDPDDDEEEPTVPCPYCRREILEDSPRCPHCERYISEEDHASTGKPLWVIATALICLGVAIWWVFVAF